MKARSEVMHSLLTYYDEKLHLKTVWNEGYEAGQEEIAELKNDNNTLRATIQDKDIALADKDAALADKDAALADKDAEIADKDAEIEELKRQLAEAKK